MNILIVVPWEQEFGGVASVVNNLASQLDRKGDNVQFLYPSENNIVTSKKTKYFILHHVRLRPFNDQKKTIKGMIAFFIYFPLTMYQIMRFLLKNKIHCVNVHYPGENSVYFALCRSVLKMRIVLSIHGSDFFPDGKPLQEYSRVLKYVIRKSDAIVAPSNAFAKDFVTQFPEFRRKTYTIHNGLNFGEIDGYKSSETTIERYILNVATHKFNKGIDVLIKAFHEIRNFDQDLQLFLVGDGPLRKQHETLAEQLNINNRIRFLGWKGREEVIKLMKGAQLFALPSRAESFGIVLLEAMACRKPVIASAVGGIPEIVVNGKNGILVESDNHKALAFAIKSLLDDNELKMELVRNGYDTVCNHFLCEKTGVQYRELFQSLIGK